ncbi:MAG: nitrous oxide reductase accessory protein NosL, partial [Acidobacteriota bacterium]
MKRLGLRSAGMLALLLTSCSRGPAPPMMLDTRTETCAWCRMSVSDPRLAAQLAARSEEPKFFDDIGCLRDYLVRASNRPNGQIAYVADHRTKEWVPAARAFFTKCPTVETPMGSHLIAHAGAASRDGDPDARGGTTV